MHMPGTGRLQPKEETKFKAVVDSMEQGATPLTVHRNERMEPKDHKGVFRSKHPSAPKK